MDPSAVVFLLFLAFALMVAAAIGLGLRASRQATALLREVADRHALELHAPAPVLGIFTAAPRLSGQVRGKRVLLHTYSTGSGKNRTRWTALDVEPNRVGTFRFRIGGQGFVSKVREVFGAKEVMVGNADFDRAFFVETNRPDFLRPALLPEFQQRILDLWRQAGGQAHIELKEGRVRYAEVGDFSNPERVKKFEAALPLLCDLADMAEVEAATHGA